jgi:phosphotransferase system IIB component
MIKVTYSTVGEGVAKPEITTIRIFDGKYFAQYNIPNKAQTTVEQMKKDGKTGVLHSRGQMIQVFHGKTEDEILEIVKKDIENGLKVAQTKTKKKLEIKDLVIEKQ